MTKRIEELKNGDIVYQYGIATFPDREFIFQKKLIIDNSETSIKMLHRDFASAKESNGVRHIIKGNEGVIYRNAVWFTERDDKKAKQLLLEYLNKKINIAQHTIDLYCARIAQVETFFEEL